jgi:hypothetical protein
MLTVSNLFEDASAIDEYLIEDTHLEEFVEDVSFYCASVYQDDFIEAAIKYIEEDDQSDLEIYFESGCELIMEGVKSTNINMGDIEGARARFRKVAEKHAKGPKRTLVRKITNRLYKNKIGRAIVRGIRKAGYGTKLGRKVMAKVGQMRDKGSLKNYKTSMNLAKLAGKTMTVAQALKRNPKASKFQKAVFKKAGDIQAKAASKVFAKSKRSKTAASAIKAGLGITQKGFAKNQAAKAKAKPRMKPAGATA